ncbi:Uncharacterised protein [Vibrio cholerae]|nr:Uncharacterised protein [Vibrio cholerae]
MPPAWLAKSQGPAGLTRRATQVSSPGLKPELKIARAACTVRRANE